MRILDFFVNLFMTNILFNLHTWRGHLKNWIQRKHALNDLLDCQYGFIRAGHGIFSLVRFLRVFLPLCLTSMRIYFYSPIWASMRLQCFWNVSGIPSSKTIKKCPTDFWTELFFVRQHFPSLVFRVYSICKVRRAQLWGTLKKRFLVI